jgi:hypothetical protein
MAVLAKPPAVIGALYWETEARKEQLIKAATLRRRVRQPHNDDDYPVDPAWLEADDNVQEELPDGFGPEVSPDDLQE